MASRIGWVRRSLTALVVCALAAACSSANANGSGGASPSVSAGSGSPGQGSPSGTGSSGGSPGAGGSSPVIGPFSSPLATEGEVVTSVSPARTSGSPPDYARMVSGAIQGLGQDVRLSVTVGGTLPQQMSDSSEYMIVSWNVSGDKKHQSVGFSAQGTNKGWSISAGGNNGTVPYPGTYSVSGNTISLTFPWSFVGGARPFEWSASSSWFQNGGSSQSYSEQNIPQAFFPKNHSPKK